MAYTTIDKGSKYFNTVLYTGNGTTQSITGVGFQPDFVWIKNRTTAYHHGLWDSVRGATNALYSSLTNAEGVESGVSAFNSDGFSVGSASGYNTSSHLFVSWNWLGANTTLTKTYAVTVVNSGGNKYRFDGFTTNAVTLEISEGGTFKFDQSDASNIGHPFRFSITSDGTHNSGVEYTTGVTTSGTAGYAGAYTQITVAVSAPTLYYYCSVHSGMGGQANTPTTNSFSNFSGSIQSNISPSTTSGFSIVSYTGAGASATIGHGLGVAPSMYIIKSRTGTAEPWFVYHKSIGNTGGVLLNSTNATATSITWFNNTSPTSSVFSIGSNSGVSGSGNTHIAYCFAEVKGYSKFGSYTGNGSADGTFIYTGFKPAFLIVKRYSSAGYDWLLYDNKRQVSFNVVDDFVFPSDVSAEVTGNANQSLDFLSNGVKYRGLGDTSNGSGASYIYMAFAENPFVSSKGIPTTAR